MNQILDLMKSYLTFFLLLMLLQNLVPGEGYRKYIRFFMGIMMALAFIYPILSFVLNQEDFLEQIQYEQFQEELSELSKDAEKIELSQNSTYLEQYEKVIEQDIMQRAENQQFVVEDIEVKLTETYEIDSIFLEITGDANNQIIIGKIEINSDGEEVDTVEEELLYQDLKEEILDCYQVTEEQLSIQYN